MSDKKFQRFGKYLILDHLVDGGMAKICRARYLGEQANKVVAIKMVQPQFSNDEAFVRMFQDELNITFGMLHPNIMQVYDYGKTQGQLYTAMEYIHGANLKQYLDRLKERKVVFPVEISCYIISQVCLGLHYAHTFTDKLTGKPYNIVHRDISPHNIMLTYDGAIKVIDFGIAKANTNSEQTQAGTIKGKLSYLAPEYLDGLELDARYDEFAVGITLWELLCSRKLFQANNDLAVLKQIQACKVVPPSQINPSVPKELDAIVLKALSKDRSQRYENLDQMNRALVRFLYSTYPEFNASDLKMFADDLFKKEISNDKDKFVEYGSIDVVPYIDDMKNEESRTGKVSKKDVAAATAPVEERKKVREIEMVMDNIPNIEIDSAKDKTGTRRLNKTVLNSAKLTSKNNKINSSAPTGTLKKPEHTNSRIMARKAIDDGEAESEGESSASRQLVIMVMAVSIAAIAYFKADMVEGLTGFNLKTMIHGEQATRKIASDESGKKKRSKLGLDEKEARGSVVLSGVDLAMDIFVDGSKHEYTGSPVKVPLNQEISLVIRKSGYNSYTTKVMLSKSNTSTVIKIPELTRSRTGLLTTSLNYTAGSKLVYEENGTTIERELPFTDLPVPEGTYQAKIVNQILGTEKRVEFNIEENKKHFLE